MSGCVFCKIVRKQSPAAIVHEGEHTLGFMDISEVTTGHVVIALKAHAENIYALNALQAGAVFGAAALCT